jgi:hypothetical protein
MNTQPTTTLVKDTYINKVLTAMNPQMLFCGPILPLAQP